MSYLYNPTKDKGKKKRAHLSEKIHSTCNGTCIVPPNISTYGIGDHHTKRKMKN